MIRLVTGNDAKGLLQVYAQYIETPITFEYTLPSVTQFQARINRIFAEYPYLVYEEEGRIKGYAYAHRHMERAAYQWNAEAAIYLDRDCCRKGIGKTLYRLLLELLRLQGIRTVYGCVTLPNAASERLHHSLGFTDVGVYFQAGYKCGKWHDVIWFEKKLLPHVDGEEPLPPCGIHDLAPGLAASLLAQVNAALEEDARS